MQKQSRWVLVFITLLLAAGLACQALSGGDDSVDAEAGDLSSSSSEEASPSEDPADETGATESAGEPADVDDTPAGPAPSAEDSEVSAVEDLNEETGEAETLSLGQDNNFGLPSDVSSYRVRFSMEITVSEDDEETQVMNIAGEGAVTTDPAASSFDFQILGAEGASAFTEMSMVQIEDSTYIVSPLVGCLSGDFGQDLIEFEDFTDGGNFVGEVSNAQLVDRNVEINGVNTDHYSFNQEDLDGSGAISDSIENFRGDLYLSDEGYLVRIALSGEGSVGFAGLVDAGETSVQYQLDYFDVGEPIEISVPEGCDEAGGSNLPVLSDAADLFSVAGITTYTTNFGIDEIVEFYKSEMEAAGWSLDLESTFGNSATLSFVRDGSTVSVIVAEDESTGSFTILLTEQ